MRDGNTRLQRGRRDPRVTPPAAAAAAGGQAALANGRPASGRNAAQGGGSERLGELARGSTLNMAGAAVAGVSTLGLTVIVTNLFPRAVAGAFFIATSAFMIVETLATLGADVGLTYFVARLRSLGEARRLPAIFRAAVIPVIMAALAGTVLLLVFAEPLGHVLLSGHLSHGSKENGATPAAVARALRALALVLPFAALSDVLLGATRGYREMRPTVFVDRMGRSLLQVAGVAVAAAAGSAAFLAPVWVLPYVPAVAIGWLWLRRIRRRHAPHRDPSPGPLPAELAALMELAVPVEQTRGTVVGSRQASRQLANANPAGFWRFTVPRGIANFASIILQRLDIVLVAIMKGPVDAAVYTAATRFLVAGQFADMAINRATQPRVTELFAVGDRRGANVIYQVTTAWLILMLWPLYLLSVIFGPVVLAVFGKSYHAGAGVMVILGLSMLLATACGQVDMVLITAGRSSWSLITGLVQVVVNVVIDVLLIPHYGIMGAAIGWAVAITIGNVTPLAQLALAVKVHPFGRGTTIAFGLVALSFGVIPLAIRAVVGHGVLALAAAVAVGGAVQLAGMWRFRRILRLGAMPGVEMLRRRLRRA